jgi:hypothetical protein
MKLDEAKALYPEEWIAFDASDDSDNPQGKVVLHHRDRRQFDRELISRGLVNVYVTFAGPLIPEGYAVMF